MIVQKNLSRGFTYTELLIVIGLLMAIMAIALPFLSQFQALNKSDTSLYDVCQNIKRAQFKAISGLGISKWGVFFNDHGYTIFSGNSYQQRDTTEDENYDLPESYLFTNTLNNEIIFDRLTGTPNKSGVVSVQINGYEKGDCQIENSGLIFN